MGTRASVIMRRISVRAMRMRARHARNHQANRTAGFTSGSKRTPRSATGINHHAHHPDEDVVLEMSGRVVRLHDRGERRRQPERPTSSRPVPNI